MRPHLPVTLVLLVASAGLAGADGADEVRVPFVHGSYNDDHLITPNPQVGGQTIHVPDWYHPGSFCEVYLGHGIPVPGGVCYLDVPDLCAQGPCKVRVTVRVEDEAGNPVRFFAGAGLSGDNHPGVSVWVNGEPLGGVYEGTGSFHAYHFTPELRVFPQLGTVAGTIVVEGQRVA